MHILLCCMCDHAPNVSILIPRFKQMLLVRLIILLRVRCSQTGCIFPYSSHREQHPYPGPLSSHHLPTPGEICRISCQSHVFRFLASCDFHLYSWFACFYMCINVLFLLPLRPLPPSPPPLKNLL